MKFLVAGIHTHVNQFTRAISSYDGCEWVHHDGDPGGHIPTDCHAAILVTSHMSHAKYYEVKAAFKEMNKPWWAVDRSFSEVVDKFENFLREHNHPVIRKGQHLDAPNTALGAAFKQATDELNGNVEEDKVMREVKSEIKQIGQHRAAELFYEYKKQGPIKMKEAVDRLNESGYLTRNGLPWTISSLNSAVYMYRQKYNLAPDNMKASLGGKKGGLKSVVSRGVTPATPGKLSAPRQLELVGKVMASKLPFEKKDEYVQEILAGVRTVEHQVIAERRGDYLQITMQSIFEDGDKPLVMLDKITAIGIMKVLGAVKDFIDGE